ncbi:MAG: hypothetical protein NT075_17905 [Chloroflexi bacterium]|nr:hypothetical protein [Chloroflexota bacterium]
MMNRQTEQWRAVPMQQTQQGVTVRPIQPNDATLIHEMHQRLSPDSIYYRYLQPRMPSMAELEQICHLDPAKGAGFVATAQSDARFISPQQPAGGAPRARWRVCLSGHTRWRIE